MNFTQILLWLPRMLRNGGLHAARYGQVHIAKTIFTLLLGLLFNVVVLGVGVLIARLGYGMGFGWAITGGKFIIAFSGMMAGAWLIYAFTRIGTFVEGAVTANDAAQRIVHELSRPLPSTPLELPIMVSPVLANQIMRIAATMFAVLTAMSVYAAIIPVYRNLTLAMVGVITIMFMGFAIAAATLRGGRNV